MLRAKIKCNWETYKNTTFTNDVIILTIHTVLKLNLQVLYVEY